MADVHDCNPFDKGIVDIKDSLGLDHSHWFPLD